jgi:hypothetical protein
VYPAAARRRREFGRSVCTPFSARVSLIRQNIEASNWLRLSSAAAVPVSGHAVAAAGAAVDASNPIAVLSAKTASAEAFRAMGASICVRRDGNFRPSPQTGTVVRRRQCARIGTLPPVEALDRLRGDEGVLERARSNPRWVVAIAAAVLLLLAWIGWAIYVTSSDGARAGLGVVIAWPAMLAALALISLPFIGGYLLVRRLSADSAEAVAAEPDSVEEDEPEDDSDEDSADDEEVAEEEEESEDDEGDEEEDEDEESDSEPEASKAD